MASMSCPFCNAVSPYLESNLAYAKFDLFPVSKGHSLIITKRHIKDYFDATDEEKSEEPIIQSSSTQEPLSPIVHSVDKEEKKELFSFESLLQSDNIPTKDKEEDKEEDKEGKKTFIESSTSSIRLSPGEEPLSTDSISTSLAQSHNVRLPPPPEEKEEEKEEKEGKERNEENESEIERPNNKSKFWLFRRR